MYKFCAFIICFILLFTATPGFAKQKKKAPVPVLAPVVNASESDQQISDFNLAGYGEKGKKTWDLSGKSADIFENVVKLKDLTGNMYGAKENVTLTADSGDFDKQNSKIHVEKNVTITTTSGAKLTTDYLDWDRVNERVSTSALVNIERENMMATAIGAAGNPSLSQMALEKNVTVQINPKPDQKDQIIITCDGALQIDYEKNVATFNTNVKVDRGDSQIYSDILELYFGENGMGTESAANASVKAAGSADLMGTKIDKIIARGNVKTVRGPNITYSDEAIYNSIDKKITLSGRPRLIIFSAKDLSQVSVKQ